MLLLMQHRKKCNNIRLKNLPVIVPAAPTVALPGCKLLHIPETFRYLLKLFGPLISISFAFSAQKLSGLVTGFKQSPKVSPKSRKV